MKRRDFYIKAVRAGACKKRAWLNAVFSIVVTDSPTSEAAQFPYKTSVVDGQLFFVDPENNNELTQITDFEPGKPLFEFLEPLEIQPYDILNWKGPGPKTTTYGNVLANQLILVEPFGDLIPFKSGFVDIRKIEDEIERRLIDDPVDEDIPPGTPFQDLPKAPDGKLYARQYIQYVDNALFLKFLSSNNVQTTSARSMTHHPDRDKVLNALLEKYKDQLNDPAIVARIGKAMELLDREWLKDDPTEGFYQSKDSKFFGSVRKKLWYIGGGESPFEDGTQVEFIVQCLEDGIDMNHMTVMNNSLRYGSFSRGNQTQLGGESTKTIYRMLGTARIIEEDCGVTYGLPFEVTERNKGSMVGLWIVQSAGDSVLLTDANIARYVGKTVRMRTPMVCKTGRNVDEGIAGKGKHICQRCAGITLSQQPGGLGAAAASVGGRFLNLFLKKMHGSTLKTAKWDFTKHIH